MHGPETVRRAVDLAQSGHTQSEIADLLAVGQTTIGRWLAAGLDATLASPSRRRASTADCPDDCEVLHRVPPADYAYLLGQYLGDGSIVRTRRDVYRLTVTCCAAYPSITEECARAMSAVLPDNTVGRRNRHSVVDVNCYSKHLPCLFPQHGPGRKHERPIVLDRWQEAIALEAHPEQLIRGLIHSDGCRSVNRVRSGTGKEYQYVRYLFSNRSEDIRGLFCDACDHLGLDWRRMNNHNISVARRASVATLESLVGPKG